MKQTIVDRIYIVIMVISFVAVIGMIIYLHRGPYRKFLESRNELNQVYSQLQMVEKLKKEQEESLKTQEMLFDIINKRPANLDFFSYFNQL
jgi:F0F1-type ATP synthase membrane subunit b/b'